MAGEDGERRGGRATVIVDQKVVGLWLARRRKHQGLVRGPCLRAIVSVIAVPGGRYSRAAVELEATQGARLIDRDQEVKVRLAGDLEETVALDRDRRRQGNAERQRYGSVPRFWTVLEHANVIDESLPLPGIEGNASVRGGQGVHRKEASMLVIDPYIHPTTRMVDLGFDVDPSIDQGVVVRLQVHEALQSGLDCETRAEVELHRARPQRERYRGTHQAPVWIEEAHHSVVLVAASPACGHPHDVG